MISPPELSLMMNLEIMHILQVQVCGCISSHPELSHHKMKRETHEASNSQLNQTSSNRTVLKFGSENQLNIHNYLSILFVIFPLSRDLLEKVTSLTVWFGVHHARTVYIPGVENVRITVS